MSEALQRSKAWFSARLGKVTASRVSDVVTRTKAGEWGAMRANYQADLIVERLTGVRTEGYVSPAMQHGQKWEDAARWAYEQKTGAEVLQTGFVDHPEIAWAGASPDGLVGEDGLVEIKCPFTATHIATLLGCSIDGAYLKQMCWQLACTGRDWCDFASFDPRLPAAMQLHVRRVERDLTLMLDLEVAVTVFLDEVAERTAKLNELYGGGEREAA